MSKNRFLFVLLIAIAGVFAAPSAASALKFEAATGSPITGIGATSDIATGDFNGDGDADLVTASDPNGLVIQLSDGDGTFTAGTTVAAGQPFYGAWTGDFNGDSKTDILALPYQSTTLRTYLGAGDGTFTFGQNTLIPDNGIGTRDSLAVGDLNEDGLDDFVVGHFGSTVSSAVADGSGGFTLLSQTLAGGQYKGAAIGDIDGDGNLDAAVATSTQIFTLKGNGTGALTPAPGPVSIPAPYDSINSLTSADFNGDGRADVAAASGSPSDGHTVQTFLGQADAGLVVNPNPFGAVYSRDLEFRSVQSGEFNGNDKPDLAYVVFEPGCNCPTPVRGASVALGNGQGHFVVSANSPFRGGDPEFANVFQMATGDIDGDGALDLAIGIFGGTSGAKVLLNTADLIAYDSSVEFGDQKVGTNSSMEYLYLVNDGGPDIDVTGISIEGADAGQFTLSPSSSDCVASLYPNQMCQIGVQFKPTSTGEKSARISVDYAQSDTPFEIPISGKGVTSAASFSPSDIDFDSIHINTTGTQTVTVLSTGEGSLDVGQLSLTGADAAQFSLSDNTCTNAVLAPNTSCTVKVTAAPDAPGPLTAALQIPHDGDGPTEVPLSAFGIDPGFSVSPASYDFAEGEVDGPGQGNQFTITSNGTSPLAVSHISVSGPDASDFDIAGSNCMGTSIPPGQSCTFTGIFHPSEGPEDDRSASFVIDSNAAQRTVPVTGTATYGDTVITPDPVEFGNVKIDGETVTKTVTLTAAGTASMYVDQIKVIGAYPELFEIVEDGCSEQQTPSGDSCDVVIRFDPDSVGDKTSYLWVDTFSQTQSPELSAAGINPAGSLTPASHDFGSVAIGATSGLPSQEFLLKSTGETPLELSGPTITGSERSFEVVKSSSCGETLAPGSSCPVTVTFKPEEGPAGERTGSFSFDTNAGPMTASYKGTATQPTPPPLVTSASVKLKNAGKVKRGKKLAVTVTVKNTGTATISGLTLKTAVTKKLAKAPKAAKVGSLAPGASIKRKIKVAVKKKAKAGKKLKVTVTASAAGKKLDAATRSAKVKK